MSKCKVLFICPIFFNYHKDILDELESRGFLVDFLADRPFHSAIARAVVSYAPWITQSFIDVYYARKLQSKKYDLVFIINGQTLSSRLLRLIRSNSPNVKLILYLWDSIKNRSNQINNLKDYDYKFSFDRIDCQNFKMNHRPLFYGRQFSCKRHNRFRYCLSFIGSIHSDRYKIISQIRRQLQDNSFYSYLYIRARWVLFFYKLLLPGMLFSSSDEFKYRALGKEAAKNIFIDSFAILDIEHPKQSGLTMRTIEAVGSGKKLITTNEDIVNYDFYNENNICLISRTEPIISPSFFENHYEPIPRQVLYKYSLSGWIDEIFSFYFKSIKKN